MMAFLGNGWVYVSFIHKRKKKKPLRVRWTQTTGGRYCTTCSVQDVRYEAGWAVGQSTEWLCRIVSGEDRTRWLGCASSFHLSVTEANYTRGFFAVECFLHLWKGSLNVSHPYLGNLDVNAFFLQSLSCRGHGTCQHRRGKNTEASLCFQLSPCPASHDWWTQFPSASSAR